MKKNSKIVLLSIGIIGGALLVALMTLLVWIFIVDDNTEEFSRAQLTPPRCEVDTQRA